MKSILSLGAQRDPPARSWALLPSDLLLIKRQLLSAHISVPNASGTPSIFPTSNYILGFDVLFLGNQIFLHAEKEESSSKLPREPITKLVKMKEEHLSPLRSASPSFCRPHSISPSLSLFLSGSQLPAFSLLIRQLRVKSTLYWDATTRSSPTLPAGHHPGPNTATDTQGSPRWHSGKESACNARDAGHAGSIPGSGRSRARGAPGTPWGKASCLRPRSSEEYSRAQRG